MQNLRLHDVLNNIWALDRATAQAFLPLLSVALRSGEFNTKAAVAEEKNYDILNLNSNSYVVSPRGWANPPEAAPRNSVAILPMMDVITKMDQECGDSGIMTKLNLIARCDANPNIKAIVLHKRSGGGEAYAGIEMSRMVQKLSKPIVAFVDDFSASASYFIASGCDNIIANAEYAQVGSIGTFLTILDFAEHFEKLGIKILDIYATDSTEKNLPYRDAIAGNTELLLKSIDYINTIFQNSIAANRADALKAAGTKAEVWNKGKLFNADEALKLGLIDGIASLEEVIDGLL